MIRKIAFSCGGLIDGKVSTAKPPFGTSIAISLPASISKGAKLRKAAPRMALRTMVRVGGPMAAGDGVASDGAARLAAAVMSRRSFVSL